MGLIHIGGEVKPGMSLGLSFGRQSTHFPYSGKRGNDQNLFFYMCCRRLLDHQSAVSKC